MTDSCSCADGGCLRAELLAHATVVAPGETLVIQAPAECTPAQLSEYQRYLDDMQQEGMPFAALVVPGDGLGVVKDEAVKEALRGLVREEVASQMEAFRIALAVSEGLVSVDEARRQTGRPS